METYNKLKKWLCSKILKIIYSYEIFKNPTENIFYRHPFFHLFIFGLIFHIIASYILLAHGLPICLTPIGFDRLAGILLLNTIIYPLSVFFLLISKDFLLKLSGYEPQPLNEQFFKIIKISLGMTALLIMYSFTLIAYLNLKPAIPVLNPNNYDAVFENLERLIFGGVLPTEYFISKLSYHSLIFWNVIYHLFAPFICLSLVICLYHEGFYSGALLTLALNIGLFVCIVLTLFFPSLGPLFIHPDWFNTFPDLNNNQLAAFLIKTVADYAQKPGTVYACAGIAAMPSYHIYALAACFMSWKQLNIFFKLFGVFIILIVWMSTFILGWHYVIDGLIGILLAILVVKALEKIYKRQEALIAS